MLGTSTHWAAAQQKSCCWLQVQQRDNEIALLLNMLKGRSAAAASADKPSSSSGLAGATSKDAPQAAEPADTAAATDAGLRASGNGVVCGADQAVVLSALLDASLLSDRHKAFEVFKQSYRQGQVGPAHCPRSEVRTDLGGATLSTVAAVLPAAPLRQLPLPRCGVEQPPVRYHFYCNPSPQQLVPMCGKCSQ